MITHEKNANTCRYICAIVILRNIGFIVTRYIYICMCVIPNYSALQRTQAAYVVRAIAELVI